MTSHSIPANGLPSISTQPTAYLYEGPDGWHRSDERLTQEINRHVYLGQPFETAGRTFYPQWPEPKDKTETKPAWILRPDGTIAVRWYWLERDHTKHHANCELMEQGRCRSRAALRLSYDPIKRLWTQVAPLNKERKDK